MTRSSTMGSWTRARRSFRSLSRRRRSRARCARSLRLLPTSSRFRKGLEGFWRRYLSCRAPASIEAARRDAMTATGRRIGILLMAGAGMLGPVLRAQEAGEPAPPPRPPEGSVIINLPPTEVPSPAALPLLITHRFTQPVQDSDVHSLFSFDSAADIKIGLAYSPLRNLEISLGRDPAHCSCGL